MRVVVPQTTQAMLDERRSRVRTVATRCGTRCCTWFLRLVVRTNGWDGGAAEV